MKMEMPVVKVSDGTEMLLFVTRPVRLPAPGILLLPEHFGIDAPMRDVASRLSDKGYIVAVPELFHRTAPRGFEGDYEDMETVAPHVLAMTERGLEADLHAAFGWFKGDHHTQRGNVGCVGFGMGGRAAFLANALLPFRAVVSFYGPKIAPDLLAMAPVQNGPLLFFWGGRDAVIGQRPPRAVADALHKAQKSFTDVTFAEADHGFFCDQRPGYHPYATHQAWAHLQAFFDCHLKMG